MDATTYTRTGAPFNFLGNLSESQKNAFVSWVNRAKPTLPAVQTFHQVRSQQLRKSAGLLEKFYATSALEALAPTFVKDTWQPGPNGHFPYAARNDHIPAMVVSNVKKVFQTRLVHQDDAVFHMNHLRAQVERQEDLAQYASDGPAKITALLARLDVLFASPEYQAALVKDLTDLYKGEPRYRTNGLAAPTPWELDNRGGNSPTL